MFRKMKDSPMVNAALRNDIPSFPSGQTPKIDTTLDAGAPRDMEIAGAVDGDISGRVITVLESGSVAGQVGADTVVIRGVVRGTVKAHRIQVLSTAWVEGELRYDELTVDNGAHLEARCVPAA